MTFADWVNNDVVPLGNSVVELLFAVAFLLFVYGVFRFFFAQGVKGHAAGKQYIVWGLVGLTVLFGVWGLVNLLLGTLTRGFGL